MPNKKLFVYRYEVGYGAVPECDALAEYAATVFDRSDLIGVFINSRYKKLPNQTLPTEEAAGLLLGSGGLSKAGAGARKLNKIAR